MIHTQMIQQKSWWGISIVCIALIVTIFASVSLAQSEEELSVTEEPHGISLWGIIVKGGPIGYLIILTSIVAVSLVVQNFLSIRSERIIPAGLIDELEEHISQKQYQKAKQTCVENGSFLARIVAAGLNQVGSMFGYFDMQNTMQETSEREISKLYRTLEYLSCIGATSPMLGLLGTVTGMISSFNQISGSQGTANPSELAGGISEALVTTCLGLVVAIPSMFFTAFFRRRIDGFVAEAETAVEKLMRPFRKAQ